jgi:hypothetical protein
MLHHRAATSSTAATGARGSVPAPIAINKAPAPHLATAAAALVLLASPLTPHAHAIGPVSVKLDNIAATRVECERGTGTVGGVSFSGSTTAAACLEVKATATNPSKKTLYSADVFGRIYDSSGEPMLDDSENARIAYVDELAPGTSEVKFLLRVPAAQFEKGPAEFRAFKASAFEGKNLPGQAGLLQQQGGSGGAADGDCEVTGTCDEEALEAMIR